VSVTIWRFSDDRPGHRAQSRGLERALAERLAVDSFEIPVRRAGGGLRLWLSGRYPPGEALPTPDLLLGAGHATHWHLLAARRCRGGRSVVMMKPTLPLACFDLCLIPQHDNPPRRRNVLPTRGVLNAVQPSAGHDAAFGLVLLGGPSRHFRWRDETVLGHIDALLAARALPRWLIATSRRTPRSLADRLLERAQPQCVPFETVDEGWLAAQMARAGEIWVSQDSVSMVFEALSSGARVGLLPVEAARGSRVGAAVSALVEAGAVGAPGDWRLPPLPDPPLNEAQRCAEWISEQWLTNR
jgi:mitochondrial fission protein ELM1